MMTYLRFMVTLAAAAALALPAAASADPNPTRASLSPTANYVSPQQINLEVGLSCEEGLFYGVSAGVLQQQGPFMQIFGNGFVNGQCTGKHQRVAIPVFSFAFPGWQLGDALADVRACAFTCDSVARSIRISL
jgi:hypothetical protein